MRSTGLIIFAASCGLLAAPFACSSNNGVEGGGSGTGGAGSFQFGSGGNGVGASYSQGTGTGSGNSAGGTDPNSSECAQAEVPIEALPPDIMLILDRSLSMTQDVNGGVCAGGNPAGDALCGTESKWYKTIVAINQVIQATQTSVNWGLYWLGNEPAVCGASATPAVPITPGTSYDPIMAAIDGNVFNGAIGTPTQNVVKNALAYMQTVPDQNPKFLLLATDGEPNCADGRNIGGVDNGAAQAIGNGLNQLGIPTFVIGIATTSVATADAALTAAAQAGGYPQQGAATSYYAVSDTATLAATLNTIIGLAASCTISLADTPSGTWSIAITATDAAGQNVLIENSATDGWAYTDTGRTSITLVGQTCENLKNGSYTNFHFVYTCEGQPIVIN